MANVTGNKEERVKSTLVMEEPLEFNAITDSIVLQSTEFCEKVSNVFRTVFADFEGSRMDPDLTTGIPAITLVFNHLERPDCDLPYACTKDIDTKTQSDTVRRVRNYTNRLMTGDTYHMTEDGKDMLEQFIMNIPRVRDKNGSVKWKEVIMNVADGTAPAKNQQYTCVSFLDVNLISKFLFGSESVYIIDPNGDPDDPRNRVVTHWIYTSKVMRSIPGTMSHIQGQVMHRDFVIKIERVKEEEVTRLGRKLGFGMNANGLDIVRAAF